MRIYRSIAEPLRLDISWEEAWKGVDQGLIACWERGRQKSMESPDLALQAREGRLVLLPWKGGVRKKQKIKKKIGTLLYLAMWQGLRGDDLDIDIDREVSLVCSATGMNVLFTNDYRKYANEGEKDEESGE